MGKQNVYKYNFSFDYPTTLYCKKMLLFYTIHRVQFLCLGNKLLKNTVIQQIFKNAIITFTEQQDGDLFKGGIRIW